MDQTFQPNFQTMQELDDVFCLSKFEDMPLSNELLDDFGTESYQATTPGGLPSPNSSNPDLPDSVRQSPVLPSLSTLTGGYGSQPNDGSLGADNDPLGPHLQQSKQTCTNTGSNTSNNSSKAYVQQVEPSMTSSSSTNKGQGQTFTAPSEGALCIPNNSFQSGAATVPIGRLMSTRMPIASKVVNNTSSTSAPAKSQRSPTSRPQHFVRNPSHLRNQIHPELSQYFPVAATATGNYATGQVPHTMSSSHNFINEQTPNTSLSQTGHQNVQHLPNKPQFRRIASAQNQSQPFQESSMRTSLTSNLGQNPWQAGHIPQPQYPDPQPMFQQQSNRSPYMSHHHILSSQGNSMINFSPVQYHMQPSTLVGASYMGHDQTDYDLKGSSQVGTKLEMSSPGSDPATSPDFKSQMTSSKSQKKRRVKPDFKYNDDNEIAVDPAALQTEDLTHLNPTDRTDVAALIDAMHNTDQVEDNLGMQKTWEKVRKAKAFRIKEVCVELLALTQRTQREKGILLGEKRPLNQYASLKQRFDALCETLRFQKTVCKHLIEPSYSHVVVDDPQYAKDRVKNNRRVNHQKAEAIRLGREHLGEKGQGKGKPMLKTKKRGQAQMEGSLDDDENSGDEPISDDDTDVSSRILRQESDRRHKHSKTLFSSPDHEVGYKKDDPHTPKKSKCINRSRPMVDTSLSNSLNGNGSQDLYSQHLQNLQDSFGQGQFKNVYAPTQSPQMMLEHDHMLYGLNNGQQMSTLNQGYDSGSGNESGNIFYGDTSTGGSDSERVSGTGYGFN